MKRKIKVKGLSGKRLLILGGAYQHIKIVEAAKSLGVITYVTDYLPIDKSLAKAISDYPLMYDIFDIDSIVDYCKSNDIDGVMAAYLDSCQIPYQRVCEILQKPCFGTKEQFEILTDKKAFKLFCSQHGADII